MLIIVKIVHFHIMYSLKENILHFNTIMTRPEISQCYHEGPSADTGGMLYMLKL